MERKLINPAIKTSRRKEDAEIRKMIRKYEKQRAKLKKEGKLTPSRKKYIDDFVNPLKKALKK